MDELQRLRGVADLMKEMGITQLKMGDIELTRPAQMSAPGPAGEDSKIEDKVEEFTSLLKLGNQEILDRMFPEPTAPGGSDEAAPTS